MNILLVEDNSDDLYFAKRELTRLGHTVVGVGSGAEALACYERERPDLVVSDIDMPEMDGFALMNEIRRRAGNTWQPVVFLTGVRDEALQLRAFTAGVDAYVVKPISAEMLDARLKVIERLLGIQRKEHDRAKELTRHYVAAEEEKRIAVHLLRYLVNADKLDDPAIQHWISPAAAFGGDVIAAARTPARSLHVLLADGPGHGLVAAINVLPIIAPFYRMTEKGFGIDAIVREMNAKVRQFLPEGRFVAATVAAIDFREGYVRIWNGGNPGPLLVNAAGAAQAACALRHLPLGVLDDHEFEATTETRGFTGDQQLLVYSDGLIETESKAGEPFGMERLSEALVGGAPETRLARLVSTVSKYRGMAAMADDVAAILVQRQAPSAPVDPPPVAAQVDASAVPCSWRFNLRLGAKELREVDVVPLLHGLVEQVGGAGQRSGELFVVFSELFNNALDHGLLRLDSRQKLNAEGMEHFVSEREVRLAALVEGEIELDIEQFEHAGGAWLRIVCRDSGPGFDHENIAHRLAGREAPFGRGLSLVRALCSSFEFNGVGNSATAVFAVSPADTSGDGAI
jgi:CheY-like chemotaxis protein/anti-sigma regulatory factor (Ser/Thr protein kinase)